MAHVFISYSSQRRDLTEKLAAFLESCGLEVWWDRELEARGPFEGQIHEKLRTAACVVVLWTAGAVTSDWVKAEADAAYDGGGTGNKLVSVTDKGVNWQSLPAPYNTFEHHRPFETELILRDVLAVREGRLLLENKREDLPAPGARTPTMLLQAKFGLVPFTGGAAVHDDLLDWALARGPYASSARRDAGRLLHGPGGLGKTRLMIEVAEALRAEGWSAGFLARPSAGDQPGDTAETRTARRERRAKALSHLIRGASDKGLLLVMDYAEGRDTEIAAIATAIRARPADDARPVRLVLLTRGVGDWWTRLAEDNQLVRALFGGEQLDVTALGGIASGKDRLDLFLAAVKTFAPRLAEMGYAVPADGEPTRLLAKIRENVETNAGYQFGEGYDRPLAIAIEALLYLAATAPGASEPGVHNLLANILGLERDHWPKLVPLRDEGGAPIAARVVDLERATGQVTAVQGIEGRRAAEALFMADRYYEGQRENRASVREVTDNVSKIYGRGDLIAPLEPDLIGEHHVCLVADEELLDGCLAWISTDADASKRDARYNDLVTVLQRATRPEHGAKAAANAAALLDYLVHNHMPALAKNVVAVMMDTPGRLREILEAALGELELNALAALDAALPHRHLQLMELALTVSQRYTSWAHAVLITAERDVPDGVALARVIYADALHALFIRYHDLNRPEDALKASKEAVEIYRALAKDRPEAFLPRLARSLDSLGGELSGLNHHEDALRASEESIKIYRALAQDRPDIFRSDLAFGLSNLGNRYQRFKRYKDALAALEEAVEIYRALSKDQPVAFSPDFFSASLDNLGNSYFLLDRHDEALAPTVEAVEIRLALVKDRPDVFLPDLARSLDNLGIRYSKLNRHEQAVEASETAVEIYRALADERPGVFLPDLARCLNNLGSFYFNADRHEDAVRASQEAVDIRRPLAKERPGVYRSDLADNLNNLGIFVRAYIEACEGAGLEPDAILLQSVMDVLVSDPPV